MKNKDYQTKMLRHGELLLMPLDELPENIEQVYQGKRFQRGGSSWKPWNHHSPKPIRTRSVARHRLSEYRRTFINN